MFILKVVLISTSGALAPGPLTAATAASGLKHGWKGGLWMSLGHAAVELPLVLLIALGIAAVLTREDVAMLLSFIGGIMLLFFAYLTAKSALNTGSIAVGQSASPFVTGTALTALNPFFIAWWAGIGAALIREALSLWGFAGIAVLYASHVWLDFAWLIFLAHVTSLGSFSMRVYRALLLFLATLVAIFGMDFIHFALTSRHVLPF